MNFFDRIANLDRRWIFLALVVVILLPRMLPGLEPPDLTVNPETKSLYDAIEALPEGAPFLLSFDFNPGSKPELYPSARAILKHAFRKKLKIIATNLWVDGAGMAANDIRDVAIQYYGSVELADEKYGEDYVFLGWRPGLFAVIVQLGESIQKTYDEEFYGRQTDTLPILKDVKKLSDFPLVVTISAGNPGLLEWLQYGQGKYNIKLGGAVTAVTAPEMFKFIRSKQLVGIVGGMKGAAGYEKLIDSPGYAHEGIIALSASHFFVISLIILSNVAYLLSRKPPRMT